MILPLSLSLIFFILASIHFNWVFGGKFGFAVALPTKENGRRILNPRKIDSAIVSIGLSAFTFFYLLRSGLIEYNMPEWVLKYVEVFKRIKTTDFGKWDTKLFSPPVLDNSNFGNHYST